MTFITAYEKQHYESVVESLHFPAYIRFMHPELSPHLNLRLKQLIRHADNDLDTHEPLMPDTCNAFLKFISADQATSPLIAVPFDFGHHQPYQITESPLLSETGQLIAYTGILMPQSAIHEPTEELMSRLKLERTISAVSSELLNRSTSFSHQIESALHAISTLSGATRAYTFLFYDGGNLLSADQEWCSPGVPSILNKLQNLSATHYPWWINRVRSGEIIHVKHFEDLPESEYILKAMMSENHIVSLLVIPLKAQGDSLGLIVFENVSQLAAWQYDDYALLKLIADVFSAAYSRRQFESSISQANDDLNLALSELRQLQAQMIHQEKMVGIGQLAAGIAHEINNPLGYVASNFETLTKYIGRLKAVFERQQQIISILKTQNENDPDSLGNPYLEELDLIYAKYKIHYVLNDLSDLLDDSKSGFQRVSDIINSLRNFARSDINTRHEYHNLKLIIDEVLQILGNEIRYVAEIFKDVDPYIELKCNRSELGQVMLNLILNGVQAIKSGERLTTGHMRIATKKEDHLITIEIEDDGVGMSEETQSHIFDPFFTTKDVGTGTGLGLSIAYDIVVNKHNAQIEVDSTLGEGTIFRLIFKQE